MLSSLLFVALPLAHAATATVYYDSTPKSWSEAQAACEARGSNLLTANAANAANAATCISYSGSEVWIGANARSGGWAWASGEAYVQEEVDWHTDDPGTDAEDGQCALMKTDGVVRNNNRKCEDTLPYCCDPVVEASVDDQPSPAPVTLDPACPRIRKEWNTMTTDERSLYIDAITELAASGVYQLFVSQHSNTVSTSQAHGTSSFLPWHRAFLLELESQIRALGGKYECFALPYWNWGKDVSTHGFVYSNYEILNSGLGSTGSYDNNYCVEDGVFALGSYTPYKCRSDWYSNDGRCCLRRKVAANESPRQVMGTAQYLALILRDEFYGFDDDGDYKSGICENLESGPHGTVHCTIGSCEGAKAANNYRNLVGHLGSPNSPDDPIFYLLHGFIDYGWALWQDYNNHDQVSKEELSDAQYYGGTAGVSQLDDVLHFEVLVDSDLINVIHVDGITPRDVHNINELGYQYDVGSFIADSCIYTSDMNSNWFVGDIPDFSYCTGSDEYETTTEAPVTTEGYATTEGYDTTQGYETTASYGADTTPGYGSETTPAYGSETTPGYGSETTPGYGTETTPGYGTETTPGYGTETTAGYGTETTPGYGSETTPGYGTETTPGYGTETTPGYGTQTTPGYGTETTPGYGTETTPGYGTETTAGYGTETTPGYGAETTPGYGTETTPGYGTETTPGYGTETTAGYGTETTPGYGTETTSGYGTETTPGYGTQTTPGYGTETTPGYATETTPGYGTETTPGYGTETTSGYGTETTAGYGTETTPGYGTETTPGYGTATTPGYGTQTTPGYGTETTPGYGTDTTPGYGTETTAGYGTETTAGYGTETTPGYGTETTSGYATDTTPGYATETTAGYGTETTAGYISRRMARRLSSGDSNNNGGTSGDNWFNKAAFAALVAQYGDRARTREGQHDIAMTWSTLECEFRTTGKGSCKRPPWFDDCSCLPKNGNSYSNFKDIDVTLDELTERVAGYPCMVETRKQMFDWAAEFGSLYRLCRGDYDAFCDTDFLSDTQSTVDCDGESASGQAAAGRFARPQFSNHQSKFNQLEAMTITAVLHGFVFSAIIIAALVAYACYQKFFGREYDAVKFVDDDASDVEQNYM